MPVILTTVGLLVLSNVFMTFAWYAHLKNLNDKPWLIAALASWGIALFEYLLQVPANRIGYTELTLAQLKIVQEVVTLTVFVPFAIFICDSRSSSTIFWRVFAYSARCISSFGVHREHACGFNGNSSTSGGVTRRSRPHPHREDAVGLGCVRRASIFARLCFTVARPGRGYAQ